MCTELSELEQRDLLDKTALQDRQAFEQLYRAYYHRLDRFLSRLLDRNHALEDLINEVMYIVWCKAGSFRGDAKVSTWIFGIAYKLSLKAIRERQRFRDLCEESPQSDQQEDRSMDRHEINEAIEKALKKLAPQHRAVVELTFFHGHTYGEIAEILDIPENTVKTRMFYAKKLVRHALPKDLYGDWLNVLGGY